MPEPDATVDTAAILLDHGQRIGRLEAGQTDLMNKLTELSAEGRIRGEHAAQQSERQAREFRQAITDAVAALGKKLKDDFKPLSDAADDIKGTRATVKIIAKVGAALAAIVALAGGWGVFMNWSGHALIMLSSHPQ